MKSNCSICKKDFEFSSIEYNNNLTISMNYLNWAMGYCEKCKKEILINGLVLFKEITKQYPNLLK